MGQPVPPVLPVQLVPLRQSVPPVPLVLPHLSVLSVLLGLSVQPAQSVL